MNEEKQIEEMAKAINEASCAKIPCEGCAYDIYGGDMCMRMFEATALYNAGYRKASEVAREFRQRMNEKMGKHTHLLGKEYVQRIMRELEKEFLEGENG